MGPSMPPLNKFLRGLMYLNAAAHMNVPAWKIILFRRAWEDELASRLGWAFGQGVAGLLADTYRVPVDHILSPPKGEGENNDNKTGEEKEPFSVNFDHLFDPTSPPSTPSTSDDEYSDETFPAVDDKINSDKVSSSPIETGHENKNDGETKGEKKENDEREEESKDDHPDVSYMLEQKLRTLYSSAREHGKKLFRIKLCTQPVSAQIESLFLVPFLTREHVEETPALRHSYRNILRHLESKQRELGRPLGKGEIAMEIGSELESLATKMADDEGYVESTVVAQVSVRCREIFSVTDVEKGEIIQGDPKELVNDVVHLVRFEMVVGLSLDGKIENQEGSWQITDWDDLLAGNVWFS